MPIVKPKPCVPYYSPPIVIPPIPGGGIIHKGIETLKHGVQNIGQLFKGHVGVGTGWGGNGAAGYYFHRRSDDNGNPIMYGNVDDAYESKKRRRTRSLSHALGWGHAGLDKVVSAGPCPVYSAQPIYPPRPYSVGLGSLIGWTKPGNQIHEGFGRGFGYSNTITYPPVYTTSSGFGWGTGYGSNFCKSDFECPGEVFFIQIRSARN